MINKQLKMTDTMKSRSNTITLNETMKSQILSMLNTVINEGVPGEDECGDELHNTLFNNEDEEEEDEFEDEETLSNTVSNSPMNQSFFNRDTYEKSRTTKFSDSFKIQNPHLYVNKTDFERKQKKFQTQNFNSYPTFTSMANLSLIPCGLNQKSTFFYRSNNNIPNCPVQNNANQGNIAPMMPLRTFSFKNMYLKQNQSIVEKQKESIPIIPLVKDKPSMPKKSQMTLFDILSVQLESLLIQNKKFTWDIYNRMKGNFINLIKNQQTSRLCQYFFDETPEEMIHLIFDEISSQIDSLLLDPYANYFCLKIFYFLKKEDRIFFLNQTVENFEHLSTNKIATYPIQCIVEKLESKEEKQIIINAVQNSVVKLSLNIYGTHVLERILSSFENEIIQPISDAILQNFLFLANNPNGLCVIKKAIIVEKNQPNFEKYKAEIAKNALLLIQNPYGNYALQAVLDFWELKDCENIMKMFYGKCILLSLQKYSSNVIEKCIEKSFDFLQKFLHEILVNDSSSTLPVLLKNNFGNYVIQTVLKCLPSNQVKVALIQEIKKNIDYIADKKVTYKWKKIITSV